MTAMPINYRALLIANWEFPDETRLVDLTGPRTDIELLKESLTRRDTGMFSRESIRELTNATHAEISHAIGRFLYDAEQTELLLLYYTGLGIPDQDGIRLCAKDTTVQYGNFLSLAVNDIFQEIEKCPASVVIVILDCRFSRRFGKGKDQINLQDLVPIIPDMSGVFILASGQSTITNAIKSGQPGPSTRYITEALTSGELDENHDGYTSFNDVYEHVRRRFREDRVEFPLIRRLSAAGGDPHLARARKPRRAMTAETPDRISPASHWARNLAIVLAVVAIVAASFITLNVEGNKHGTPLNGGTSPPRASRSFDLAEAGDWNMPGRATPIVIHGKQIEDGMLIPVGRHTVALSLILKGSVRAIRLSVGLTQQSTPGVSIIEVHETAHPRVEAQISLRPDSTGQLGLTGLTSHAITFDLMSTVNCCQTIYLGDVKVTSALGKASTVAVNSNLQTADTTVIESTSSYPFDTMEGVSVTPPFSDAIVFTLDSAGQRYMEQRFGRNDKPLNRFSTTIFVVGEGASPVKAVSVRIYANAEVVAGPLLLKPGDVHHVNVKLGGTNILRLVAQAPQDSCCYEVDFGDPVLSVTR